MNGKQILYHGLKLCGMERFYRRLHITADDINELEFFYYMVAEISLCLIVRGILWDQIPELYQILK